MEQSNSAKVYAAYRAKWAADHPNVSAPRYLSFWDTDGRDVSRGWHASASELTGRVFTSNGLRSARILSDGRVAERSHDTRGNELFAVFANRQEFDNYAAPMGRREFFEEW